MSATLPSGFNWVPGPIKCADFTSKFAPFQKSGGRKQHKRINKKILKTTFLWTSRSVWGTKEKRYFG